ncbi:hypothetical protein A3D05_01940 [Candidatus Gottesmanbacteria bacterium RIFCSPHIGHO2_02_FULL_40_24]|nr:MAG: hypothetical protein A3D05_01940 [Candidatus Gottesmanbacteria bacterium RIFCSPHIGHO2_02_FULL_40_24]
MDYRIITILLIIFVFLFPPAVLPQSEPQEEKYEAIVSEIKEEGKIEVGPGVFQPFQKAEVKITNGLMTGKTVIAQQGGPIVSNDSQKMKIGDKIIISRIKKFDGSDQYFFLEYVRRTPLIFLSLIFIFAIAAIGGIRGLSSFLGLIISFIVLLKYIIPGIAQGGNKVNNKLSFGELFKSALNIGRDHIASLVNTLVLAYAGASLRLLLLFSVAGSEPLSILLNKEMVVSEIVRTLVGSLGLVSAVPVTTFIAAGFAKSEISKS